jgi:hypothetical protein
MTERISRPAHLRLRFAGSLCWACILLALFTVSAAGKDPTLEDLKAHLANAGIPERPALCIQISEMQLNNADKLFAASDNEKAQAALVDVVAFSELARDYSIQSHKREKQTEIAIRKMTRKLADLKHTVTFADQKPIQDAIDRLQKIRDDLLTAMFPKGKNK